MRRVILVSLLAACGTAGCDSAPTTPFSPSAGLASAPVGAAAVASWQLTTTLTSVAGPPVCFDGREAIGARSDRLLEIGSDGDTITLAYDVRNPPTGHVELVGTVHDDRFEAATSWIGYQLCAGVQVDYRFDSYVTGAISEDGRSITASERWTYRLSPDESVVLWFAWEAAR